mmetsp:Transcript_28790/g.81091  ORF Transcript_28790/g.81091 Transcript_28790/m.81091 type:complete len:273 (+) Transcript_28790:233-1051(+)
MEPGHGFWCSALRIAGPASHLETKPGQSAGGRVEGVAAEVVGGTLGGVVVTPPPAPVVVRLGADHLCARRQPHHPAGPTHSRRHLPGPDLLCHSPWPLRALGGPQALGVVLLPKVRVARASGIAGLRLEPALPPQVLVDVKAEALLLGAEHPQAAGLRRVGPAAKLRPVRPPLPPFAPLLPADLVVSLARVAALPGVCQLEVGAPHRRSVASVVRVEPGVALPRQPGCILPAQMGSFHGRGDARVGAQHVEQLSGGEGGPVAGASVRRRARG